jgi:hypothetical protein
MEKKIDKKLMKSVLETRKMIEENLSSQDKYKNIVVNVNLLKHKGLHEAWECLHDIGSVKDDLGRLFVPCCFHEKVCSNYFKFLMFQQEHYHAVVPGDFKHRSLSNWLKNQRYLHEGL